MKHLMNFNKRKLALSLMAALAWGGVSSVSAETLTEDFDNVTRLDANGNEITSNYTYGYSLSNGWFVSPESNIIGTSKSYHYGIANGGSTGNALWAGYGSSNDYYIVIPTMLQGEVSFKAYKNTSTKTPSVKFFEVTETDGTFSVTSNQLGNTVTPSAKSWNDYSINIGEEGKYIAIHMIYSGLDDFSATIYEEDGVKKPNNLDATNVTYNSAVLSWTARNEETNWQLAYSTDTDFNADEVTPIDVTENPYTLTGLTENTTYYFCVRAKVGEEVSAWSAKKSFTTAIQFPAPTAFSLTNYTANTASFTWAAGSDETAWQIAYDTNADFNPTEAGTKVDVTTNPYTLEGLTAETTYFAYIRANYNGNYSAWSEKVEFTPSNTMNLVLNEGTTTNGYIPIYGYYVDNAARVKSQFIIPATDLASMANRQITSLTFYTSATSSNWKDAIFDVYIKEVSFATFNSSEFDWSEEKVYSGTLSINNDGTMVITLDNPFDYADGNLMIGINETTAGGYSQSNWYGVTTTGTTALHQGYSSIESASFLPKMTITSVPQSATPMAKMEVTPAAIEFGKITPETDAEDKVKTFTISNKKGKADLTNINVVSNNAAFVIGEYATSIAMGGEDITVNVTINTENMEAGEQNATITVTADDQTAAEIAITATYANAPATMEITPSVAETIAFGNVNKATTKTFTVANNGDMALHVTSIASDNTTDFTVAPATLDVAAGETGEFTVTFVYDENALNAEKTANITLQATGLEDVTFAVTGTRTDVWSEDFEAGVMPEGWEANGIVVKTGSVGGYPTYTLDSYVAVGNGGKAEKTLITPLLSATEGETLSFDGFFYYGDETFKVDYSTDLNTWNNLYTYDKSSYDNGSTNNIEIQSPITGKFYLRFVVNYYNGVDNIVGFHLAKAEEHEAIVAAQTIPATGTQYVEYTATADVKVTGTNDEELTVKFFIGDTQYGETVTKTVASGETETFTVTFTTEESVSGDAYFTVSNADINLESAKTAVDIAAAPVISETAEENPFEAKTYDVMVLDYKAKKGWNTIALPFTLTDLSVFGTDVKAFEFDSFTDGVLSFKKVEKISNQTPALLYVGGEPATEPIVLKNVTVNSASASLCATTKGDATFQGVYAKTVAGDLTDKYGVSKQGVIGKISATGTLNAMRAYFDITVAEGTRLSLSIDGGMSTDIDGIFTEGLNENVYNLQGQKVMNAQKGLYIVNGKKVVKK